MKNKKKRQKPQLAIIGCGKVGTALGALLARRGWKVSWLYDQDHGKMRTARKFIPGARAIQKPELFPSGAKIIIIAVGDDQIKNAAQKLAQQKVAGPDTVVIHTSGAKGIDELAPLKKCGTILAVVHPIQTFADIPQAMANLAGSFFDASGDPRALPLVRRMVADLHGKLMVLNGQDRVLAHVAGVLASNYLCTLLDGVTTLFKKIRIDDKKTLAIQKPLIRATLDNIFANGPVHSLTGPIARGDESTIALHLATLWRTLPALLPLYGSLGQGTVALALKKKSISRAKARKIIGLFKRYIS